MFFVILVSALEGVYILRRNTGLALFHDFQENYILPSVLSILTQIKVYSLRLKGQNNQLPKSTLNVLECGYCDWRHQGKIDDVTF